MEMLGLKMSLLALPLPVAIATPLPPSSASPADKALTQPTLLITQPSASNSRTPANPAPPPSSTSGSSNLLCLNPGTDKQKTPLFLIHPIGGTVTCYTPLLQALQLDRPIYGLRSAGLEGETVPLKNLRQMATHYIETLRTIQPQGSYLLGGWSMGGAIAYEIAYQLSQRGESVQGLILIDSPAPVLAQAPPELPEQIQGFCRSLGFSWKQAQQAIKSLPPNYQSDTVQSDTVALQHLLERGKQIGIFRTCWT